MYWAVVLAQVVEGRPASSNPRMDLAFCLNGEGHSTKVAFALLTLSSILSIPEYSFISMLPRFIDCNALL